MFERRKEANNKKCISSKPKTTRSCHHEV